MWWLTKIRWVVWTISPILKPYNCTISDINYELSNTSTRGITRGTANSNIITAIYFRAVLAALSLSLIATFSVSSPGTQQRIGVVSHKGLPMSLPHCSDEAYSTDTSLTDKEKEEESIIPCDKVKKIPNSSLHKVGTFSPLVLLGKIIVGDGTIYLLVGTLLNLSYAHMKHRWDKHF